MERIQNTYSWKKRMLERNLDKTAILIFGNSMTFCGIIPERLKYPAYNLANNSQDLYYDSKLASLYIDRLPNLRYILVPINYASFEYTLDQGVESWRTGYYRQAFQIPPRTDRFDIKDHSAILRYGLQRSLTLTLAFGRSPLYAGIDSLGWFNGGSAELDSIHGGLQVKGDDDYKADIHALHLSDISKNTGYLARIIEMANIKNIRVILFSAPVSRYYTKHLGPENPILKRQKIVLTALCEKYKVRYWSYTGDQRFFDCDFSDIKHLNRKGAEKFSELINYEILN